MKKNSKIILFVVSGVTLLVIIMINLIVMRIVNSDSVSIQAGVTPPSSVVSQREVESQESVTRASQEQNVSFQGNKPEAKVEETEEIDGEPLLIGNQPLLQ